MADVLVLVLLVLILAVAGLIYLRIENHGERRRSDDAQAREESARARQEQASHALAMRQELSAQAQAQRQEQASQAQSLRQEVLASIQQSQQSLQTLRDAVEQRLDQLRRENVEKLEKIRHTVDEQLQGTLEKRLGESFKQVTEQLQQVYQGLGEMRNLASGVGDLKRVLTNVKTRGTWGEVQLGSLLEQVLTPEQYLRDAQPKPGSAERVEFAIRLPGRGEAGDSSEVLLPVDAKFPQEDYERLLQAADRADAEGVETAAKALEARIKASARDIRDKYICPPHTTDFAILFLPTEGLYAEVLRRPGMVDSVQRDYRVTLAGPTTLAATLNALQMGFRTLAIQKRSSEVWQVLEAVKTEFGKFEAAMDKVQKKLQEASLSIDQIGIRRRAIDRSLRTVGTLPEADSAALLGLDRPDLLNDDGPDEGQGD